MVEELAQVKLISLAEHSEEVFPIVAKHLLLGSGSGGSSSSNVEKSRTGSKLRIGSDSHLSYDSSCNKCKPSSAANYLS